jgi:hypothetical protein
MTSDERQNLRLSNESDRAESTRSRMDVAGEQRERILRERSASGLRTFDATPSPEAEVARLRERA